MSNPRVSTEQSNGKSTDITPESNVACRVVHELSRLLAEIQDNKTTLKAKGVPMADINRLIDLGLHKNTRAQEALLNESLKVAEEECGSSRITERELRHSIDELISLQSDLRLTRQVARAENLDMSAINILGGIFQKKSPEIREQVLRNIVEYATACGVQVESVQHLVPHASQEHTPSLPIVNRKTCEVSRKSSNLLMRDAIVGLLIAISAMALIT